MPLTGLCNPTGSPAWTRAAAIGDYGGATDKRDSETEGDLPYAFQIYMELRAQRGSAFSQNTTDLVHAENLALSRTLGCIGFRGPERMRANAVPARSDERLDYWAKVLAVPVRAGDERWQIRQRCAASFKASSGPTLATVTAAVSSLLGDAFVAIRIATGATLSAPPPVTYWPVIAPGPASYSLGGGAWLSERCHLFVETTKPAGMSQAAYHDLLNVQLFQLLDRMLPAWATFDYGALGFTLDVSQLDITGIGT